MKKIFVLIFSALFVLTPLAASPTYATETGVDEAHESSETGYAGETGRVHEPSAPLPVTTYQVVNVSSWSGANFNQRYFACSAGSHGVTCGNHVAFSATRSIELALGANWGTTASQLGISSSSAQTVTGSCTRTLAQGQRLVVYPYGTWKRYQIKKTTSRVGSTTSGYLYAFDPWGIHCVVE
ncbi:hypothetical protein [Canibacter oris]|uniref:Uncharacterized protein n=1 Tax=Canibacter oris TaxID=1365628 RepID=A0A840DRF8_9MICO|nr:hypothetical protein [Canibacter oris]MBB4071746.1 hypothetical protein [Canibacter oris]